MRTRMLVLTRLSILASSLITLTAVAAAGPQGDQPLSGEGILELVPGASIQAVAARYGFVVRDSIASRGIHLVSLELQMTPDAFEILFATDADIDHSELNYLSGDPGSGTQSIFLMTPPEQFQQQPVRQAMGVEAAQATVTGAGVTIAVIDSGVDPTHPNLEGSISPLAISFLNDPAINDPAAFADVCNGIDDDGDGLIDEMVGHGTAVASLALMVAPDATILPIRIVNDEGHTTAFRVAKAIYYAIDNNADVINLSLSTRADLRILDRAVDDAAAQGIILVAAAGNNSSDIPEYPAAMRKVAGVVAVDESGSLAGFSNYGVDYFISVPGTSLTGAIPAMLCGPALPPSSFGEADGTSLAAPLVAGTAALLIQKGTIRRWDDFRWILRKTARDISGANPGFEDVIGVGMLDIAAAVASPGPCHADLNDDGILDFGDIGVFVGLFLTGDIAADLNADGILDNSDIGSFIAAFLTGC
ncbi:MAG: subtilisin family serine protease [Phycisphaerales bacterium]|jgi:subtilisin family serine protease